MHVHSVSFNLCVYVCVHEKLRAASEYEERKIIRAAIRHIRDEQQQGLFFLFLIFFYFIHFVTKFFMHKKQPAHLLNERD